MGKFGARMSVIEWPTLAIASLIYAGWIALTAFHARAPLPVLGTRAASLQSTLVGQMIFGPALSIGRSLIGETRRAIRSTAAVARDWTPHLIGVAALLWWLDHIGLNLATSLPAFVYSGTALTMLRSYAEHRADLASPGRAARVEREDDRAMLGLAGIVTAHVDALAPIRALEQTAIRFGYPDLR